MYVHLYSEIYRTEIHYSTKNNKLLLIIYCSI